MADVGGRGLQLLRACLFQVKSKRPDLVTGRTAGIRREICIFSRREDRYGIRYLCKERMKHQLTIPRSGKLIFVTRCSGAVYNLAR